MEYAIGNRQCAIRNERKEYGIRNSKYGMNGWSERLPSRRGSEPAGGKAGFVGFFTASRGTLWRLSVEAVRCRSGLYADESAVAGMSREMRSALSHRFAPVGTVGDTFCKYLHLLHL